MRLALVGVPNCGKTALFNRLTGSRQKVANYAGVTVERKEGSFVGPARQRQYRVLDLPGAYSLTPTTLDEAITRDVLLGRLLDEPPPEFIVCVVDATNLRLNLRLVLELRDLGVPMVVALNMSDLAAGRGYKLDRHLLETRTRRTGRRPPSPSSTAGIVICSRSLKACLTRARTRRRSWDEPIFCEDRIDAARGAADPAGGGLRRAAARECADAARCDGHASGRQAR